MGMKTTLIKGSDGRYLLDASVLTGAARTACLPRRPSRNETCRCGRSSAACAMTAAAAGPGRVELLTGIESITSRPLRKIVLIEG